MNYCRICEQNFASVGAFDYHLPPAQLPPREARLVHLDASELVRFVLRRNERGAWSIHRPGFGGRERLSVKPRSEIWPARLREAGLT